MYNCQNITIVYNKEALLGGLRMSLVWISKPFVSRIEEEAMSLSVFYYCICPCPCRCRSFNPSLCRLLPFRPSYVAVSRPRRLSKFTLTGPHEWESWIFDHRIYEGAFLQFLLLTHKQSYSSGENKGRSKKQNFSPGNSLRLLFINI